MIAKVLCEQVLSRALSCGGTFAELFYEDTRAFGMALRSGKIENAAAENRSRRRRLRERRSVGEAASYSSDAQAG